MEDHARTQKNYNTIPSSYQDWYQHPAGPLEGGLCPLQGAFRVQHPSVHDLVHIHKPSEVGTVIPVVQTRELERGSPPHHLGSGSAGPRTQAWSPPGPWSTATLRC